MFATADANIAMLDLAESQPSVRVLQDKVFLQILSSKLKKSEPVSGKTHNE